MTTIRNLLADQHFQQKKVLEKLICHHCNLSKEQLMVSYDMEIPTDALHAIKVWYDAYTIDKKPLEFVLGYVEFYQRRFTVDGRCLIPRPETEYMIEGVCDYIGEQQIPYGDAPQSKNLLVDVGTGCGVLGLSVLLENPQYFSQAYLTEYFPDTLSLAQENYNHYKDHIPTHTQLVQADLIDFLVTPSAPGFPPPPPRTNNPRSNNNRCRYHHRRKPPIHTRRNIWYKCWRQRQKTRTSSSICRWNRWSRLLQTNVCANFCTPNIWSKSSLYHHVPRDDDATSRHPPPRVRWQDRLLRNKNLPLQY